MKRFLAGFVLVLCAGAAAAAGPRAVVTDHVLPATAEFAATTRALASAAGRDCRAAALRPGFHAAFDAWLGLGHLRFGPLEDRGRGLAIAFWPDGRGLVGRTVSRLLRDEDPTLLDPAGFAQVSVAGRGLFALERLIFDPALSGYRAQSHGCRLVQVMSADLAAMAEAVDAGWRQEFAPLLLSAGQAGNSRFLSGKEAVQLLYTAFVTGLDFIAQQRLGRPMGEFDAPRPHLAEARRSGRPLRNVTGSLTALRDFARALSDGPIPRTEAAFAAALDAAARLDDPLLAGVADPRGRFRVEALQGRVAAIARVAAEEMAPALGVSVGFNAADGD